ncbi:outer membrane transport family protein [Rhodoferax antarcticus ANT.BR]|uniref:Outer membrane transport family protein n=1 Tax=Rhodoferax antarcticus ANT.BR TaxID=1111071 RepID=A0A1Q8YKL5_9BURK|nr:outer membrane transport family protein [Rhodoferax antarcticus ANT.BR]
MAVAAALSLPMSAAMATNGMLMEGYAAVATSMGGAAQAHDVGNAGMAQNPATLALQPDGTSRFAINVGMLQPDVESSAMGMTSKSGGDFYLMPSMGYTKRNGAWTYGIGVFAHGGMGTEYDGSSVISAMQGLPSRSELGVGNVLIPVAYQVNSDLTVAATLKFVWASLDIQMTGSVAQLAGYLAPQSNPGNLVTNLSSVSSPTTTFARIDFSDDNKFSGAAKATGFGAILGATYRVNSEVLLGASYQLRTRLSDMQTNSTGASFGVIGSALDVGKMTIIDFQMPSVLAVGGSWQVNPSWLLVADLKYIGWADSMKSFRMRYDSSISANGSVDFAIKQEWKDQTVLNLGAAWKASEQLTLRAGVSFSDNPVPDQYVHPLFPAIEKNHVMFGFGYKFTKADSFNASLAHAPKVAVTNNSDPSMPLTISHSQNNLQLGYSRTF